MSGDKRNADKLNTIGIVVVGLCGAVLVYVTIVALEAFYVNDTSEIQTIADYGGQDSTVRSLRTDQLNRIAEYASNPKPAAPKANEAAKPQTYRIPVDRAMKLVVESAKADPSALVPTLGRSDKGTVMPIFGRPRPLPTPAAPGGAAPGGAAPGGAAPGGAAPAGSAASAAPAPGGAVDVPSVPLVPTGAGTGPAPVAGAGALDKSPTPGTPGNPTGPTPDQAIKGANAAGTVTHAGSNAAAPPANAGGAGAARPPGAPPVTPITPPPSPPKAGSASGAPRGNGK
jgi:hypothetical protein